MANHASQTRTGTRWAPWWLYLTVILGANYIRQALMPAGTLPEWAVVLVVLAMSAGLFAVSTVAYRLYGRRHLDEHLFTQT